MMQRTLPSSTRLPFFRRFLEVIFNRSSSEQEAWRQELDGLERALRSRVDGGFCTHSEGHQLVDSKTSRRHAQEDVLGAFSSSRTLC